MVVDSQAGRRLWAIANFAIGSGVRRAVGHFRHPDRGALGGTARVVARTKSSVVAAPRVADDPRAVIAVIIGPAQRRVLALVGLGGTGKRLGTNTGGNVIGADAGARRGARIIDIGHILLLDEREQIEQ